MDELDAKQKRTVAEGLIDDELALFDLLRKHNLTTTERERVKQASRELLASMKDRLSDLDRFWEKEQTKAEVKVLILNEVHVSLPTPPVTPNEKETVASEVLHTFRNRRPAAHFPGSCDGESKSPSVVLLDAAQKP